IELVQPAVMVVKPGESFQVPCKITGYTATSTCTDWIRQASRKTLEIIGWYCSSSDTGSVDSLKNKIHYSAEASSNTVILHGQNFQAEDTAVYYCAREHSVHCVELIQTRSTVLTPCQSLTLTCKVSGYSLTSTYCTNWIRQPAGKTLEWVGNICHNGNTHYSEKLKSRFQVTRDTSSNTVTLTGQNMQTEDTAVYYCARYPH
ncbi:hypothetical protein C0J45_23735, partial [Silurus meridionalis]